MQFSAPILSFELELASALSLVLTLAFATELMAFKATGRSLKQQAMALLQASVSALTFLFLNALCLL